MRRPSEPAHPPSKRSSKNEEASSSSQPAASTPVIQVEIEDDEVAEAKYDRWATGKGKTAQEPSKIWRSQQGGTLWLGGLPVASTVHKFPAATLQVCCFSKPVKAKGGVQLPNAMMITIAPSTKRSREAGWPLIKQTLFAAEDVFVHCMAGRHRGGGIAVLCRALLANESLEEAETAIAKVRDIDLRGLWQDHIIAEWMASMKAHIHGRTALTAYHRVHGYSTQPHPLDGHRGGSPMPSQAAGREGHGSTDATTHHHR